jgi:hypothetical protein
MVYHEISSTSEFKSLTSVVLSKVGFQYDLFIQINVLMHNQPSLLLEDTSKVTSPQMLTELHHHNLSRATGASSEDLNIQLVF